MPGPAAIIMVTHGGLERATRPCIESLYRHTPEAEFELIVVDNRSPDGTRRWLEELAGERGNLRFLPQGENLGFAAGCNVGLRAARSDHLVLLNNDTLLTPGWLARLRRPLEEEGIGMCGPVSNSVGNEQRILLEGIDEGNYLELARAYTERQAGVRSGTTMLGFFCAALHRRVLDRVGLLDEGFGLGMFEDDDYCLRARRAGFRLLVVEDCFVYHQGSLSFNRLAPREQAELFDRNRRYFLEKHGRPWNLTDHAFSFWRKMDGDLRAHREERDELDPALERIAVRLHWFKHLLAQIQDAELRNNGFPPAPSPEARKSLREMRLRLFRQQFLRGTPREKLRFLGACLAWLRRRPGR